VAFAAAGARLIGLAGWGALAALLVALAVAGSAGRGGVPRVVDVVGACIRSPLSRGMLLTGWLIVGWHLFLAPPGG
jgi:hypothetical protein